MRKQQASSSTGRETRATSIPSGVTRASLLPLLFLVALGGCTTSAQPHAPRWTAWTAWTACGLISFGPCPANRPIGSVTMTPASEGWAFSGVDILHYTGGRWVEEPEANPTRDSLNQMAMASPTEGWAVSLGGDILHYANGAWSLLPNLTGGDLLGLAMVSPSEGCAVGVGLFGGTILHYTTQ
jgi:hypothetical protein